MSTIQVYSETGQSSPQRALAHQIRCGAILSVDGDILTVTSRTVRSFPPTVTLAGNIIPAGTGRVTAGAVTLDMGATVTSLSAEAGGDALRRARQIAAAEKDVHELEAMFVALDEGTVSWSERYPEMGGMGKQEAACEEAWRELDDARAHLAALRGSAAVAA